MPGSDNPTAARTVHAHIQGRARLFSDPAGEKVAPEAVAALASGVIPTSKELPVSAIAAEFYTNSFPSARIIIPVGKPADSDTKADVIKARDLADRLKTFQRVEVVVSISGEFAPGVPWPDGEIRVFNGYVTGTSTMRSANTVSVVVAATHWLMDLDASSTLSSRYVKGSGVAIGLPASGKGWATYVADSDDEDLINFTDDVWLDGIKNKFLRLCRDATLAAELECMPEGTAGLIELSNDIALPRLDGTGDGSFDNEDVIDVPHLDFFEELDAALDGELSQSVSITIFTGTSGNSSVWDQLMNLAQQLHFTIIPTVDSAVCAPLAPCLAGDNPPRHVTIKANEYWSAQPSEGIFRLYRGLSLHGQFTSLWGAYNPENINSAAYFASDGCYIAENDPDLDEDVKALAQRGAIVYDRAPAWLDDKSMQAVLMEPNTSPDKNPTTTMQDIDEEAEMAAPTEEEIFGPPAELAPASARDNVLAKSIGNAYAKWRYWNDTLLSRTGQITGKLRFDIAPGTIVRIEDIDGKLYDDPAEFGYIYAQVTGVQFSIDAQNNQASTTLTLSHIRRESERKMGTDGHPLYKDLWVGTVLQHVAMQTGGAGADAAEAVFIPVPGSHEHKPR